MHLKPAKENVTHLSHFMVLVSAYCNHKEKVKELAESIVEAQKTAKKTRESIMVSQDCLDFFFVVHPSGTIDLCCRMRSYEVDTDR